MNILKFLSSHPAVVFAVMFAGIIASFFVWPESAGYFAGAPILDAMQSLPKVMTFFFSLWMFKNLRILYTDGKLNGIGSNAIAKSIFMVGFGACIAYLIGAA